MKRGKQKIQSKEKKKIFDEQQQQKKNNANQKFG